MNFPTHSKISITSCKLVKSHRNLTTALTAPWSNVFVFYEARLAVRCALLDLVQSKPWPPSGATSGGSLTAGKFKN
jgi:hypothetical protein